MTEPRRDDGQFNEGGLEHVVPRQITSKPRCADCRDAVDPYRPSIPPMWHPAHPWGPCIVTLPGGDPCPCEGRSVRSIVP
jgi:hypothetical protein